MDPILRGAQVSGPTWPSTEPQLEDRASAKLSRKDLRKGSARKRIQKSHGALCSCGIPLSLLVVPRIPLNPFARAMANRKLQLFEQLDHGSTPSSLQGGGRKESGQSPGTVGERVKQGHAQNEQQLLQQPIS